jgi:hypothetical protein
MNLILNIIIFMVCHQILIKIFEILSDLKKFHIQIKKY